MQSFLCLPSIYLGLCSCSLASKLLEVTILPCVLWETFALRDSESLWIIFTAFITWNHNFHRYHQRHSKHNHSINYSNSNNLQVHGIFPFVTSLQSISSVEIYICRSLLAIFKVTFHVDRSCTNQYDFLELYQRFNSTRVPLSPIAICNVIMLLPGASFQRICQFLGTTYSIGYIISYQDNHRYIHRKGNWLVKSLCENPRDDFLFCSWLTQKLRYTSNNSTIHMVTGWILRKVNQKRIKGLNWTQLVIIGLYGKRNSQ